MLGSTFGFMVGGPLGAMIGAALGHHFDQGLGPWTLGGKHSNPGTQGRVQPIFMSTTFQVMGHVAKVDGRVTEQEIAAARAAMVQMGLTPDQTRVAMDLFREGKHPDFPLDTVLDEFRRHYCYRYKVIQLFIEIELAAAYADGELSHEERELLLHICDRLRFPRLQFEILNDVFRSRRGLGHSERRPSLADAYAVLGLESRATDAEVTRAYRQLINQHHPDKLIAQGLSEAKLRLATERTREIKAAYERIKVARGF